MSEPIELPGCPMRPQVRPRNEAASGIDARGRVAGRRSRLDWPLAASAVFLCLVAFGLGSLHALVNASGAAAVPAGWDRPVCWAIFVGIMCHSPYVRV